MHFEWKLTFYHLLHLWFYLYTFYGYSKWSSFKNKKNSDDLPLKQIIKLAHVFQSNAVTFGGICMNQWQNNNSHLAWQHLLKKKSQKIFGIMLEHNERERQGFVSRGVKLVYICYMLDRVYQEYDGCKCKQLFFLFIITATKFFLGTQLKKNNLIW